MTDHTRRSPEGERGPSAFDTGSFERSSLETLDSTHRGRHEERARRQAESERAAAQLSAELQKQQMNQLKNKTFDKKPDGPGFWKRSKELLWGGTKKTASVTGTGTALVGVGVFELLAKIPKAIGYKMSDIVTGIESWGQQTLSKHKWLKFIPFIGPWLLKKPGKTWRELDAEEAKKKKTKKESAKAYKDAEATNSFSASLYAFALSKKESAKAYKDAEKELVASGLTKKQAKALLKVKKDETSSEDKEEKSGDAGSGSAGKEEKKEK